MAESPGIVAAAAAEPPYRYDQEEVVRFLKAHLPPAAPGSAEEGDRQVERLFAASRVERRHSCVELASFYAQARTTGQRMVAYQTAGYELGRRAVEACLERAGRAAEDVSDVVVVSCTGYSAPGLDIQLARDLGMRSDVRRLMIGHMGCYGALVGLRQCVAALRAYPDASVLLLSVELSSLHFMPSRDADALTSFALFGDAAAAVLVEGAGGAGGPALVDTYCAADFAASNQMTWTITDAGFIMGLSPRVPVTLRRNIRPAVERLLDAHGLRIGDVAHWLIHPGGPSILDVIQGRLELNDEQMAPSWRALREHGNCSSTTVLLILDELLRAGTARSGEWGVMMAFGPGLTLETCLLRF